jgi:hypothetical protein
MDLPDLYSFDWPAARPVRRGGHPSLRALKAFREHRSPRTDSPYGASCLRKRAHHEVRQGAAIGRGRFAMVCTDGTQRATAA